MIKFHQFLENFEPAAIPTYPNLIQKIKQTTGYDEKQALATGWTGEGLAHWSGFDVPTLLKYNLIKPDHMGHYLINRPNSMYLPSN